MTKDVETANSEPIARDTIGDGSVNHFDHIGHFFNIHAADGLGHGGEFEIDDRAGVSYQDVAAIWPGINADIAVHMGAESD